METDTKGREEEEEFVLLDLDEVCGKADIPPNAPYVLSGSTSTVLFGCIGQSRLSAFSPGILAIIQCECFGTLPVNKEQRVKLVWVIVLQCRTGLDTINPVLVIGDELKLIGEYQETIGTCFVFSENDGPSVTHEEAGQSEENTATDRNTLDENQGSEKQEKPIARLQKILKFRLCPDIEAHAAEGELQISEKQPEAENPAADVEAGSCY